MSESSKAACPPGSKEVVWLKRGTSPLAPWLAGHSWGSKTTRPARGTRHYPCAEPVVSEDKVESQMPLTICFAKLTLCACSAKMADLRTPRPASRWAGNARLVHFNPSLLPPGLGAHRRGNGSTWMCASMCGASGHQRTLGLSKTRGSSISCIPQTLDISSRFSTIIFRCVPP